MRRLGISWVFAVVVCTAATFSHAAVMVYFEEDGGGVNPRGMYNFDTTTGISTLRTTVAGSERFFAMDVRPSDGVVFAVTSPVNSAIYTINLNTGVFTLVGATGLLDLSGLAFQPGTGKLFGLKNGGGLYSVNQSTGAATFIGSTGSVERGLSFSPSGTLYGFTAGGALYTLNPATGAATSVGGSGNPITPGSLAEDSAFTSTGELFATDFEGRIFKTDPATGNGTIVGNTGMGTGLLAATFFIPDPAGFSVASLTLAIAAPLTRRRTRRRSDP